jgi:hypothetical protein
MERRTQRADDRVHEIGEYILRVVEFDAGKIAGIAGDVGDQETGAFRLGQHGNTPRVLQNRTLPERRAAT